METKYIQFSVILILSLLLFGCNEEIYDVENYKPALAPHYLIIDEQEFQFSRYGSTREGEIQSSESWSFSEVPSWLTVSPSEGNSDAEFSITAGENKSASSREAVLFVTTKDSPVKIQRSIIVSQYAGSGYFEYPDGQSFSLNGSAHQLDVRIETNMTDVRVSVEGDWLSATYNEENNIVSIDIQVNGTSKIRTGYVYLKSDQDYHTGYIKITQSASNLEVGEYSLVFDADGGSVTRTIIGDLSWTATSSTSWVDVSPNKGDPGKTDVTISVLPSYKNDSRNAYLTFNSGESIEKYINVFQYGRYINISESSISLPSNEDSSHKLKIDSNVGWIVTSCPDWLELSPMSGERGDSEIMMKVTKNNSLSSRSGTVEICDSYSGGIKKTITVEQAGISFNNNVALEFGWKQSSLPLSIPFPNTWKAETSRDWIHLSDYSGNGETEITVSVDQNDGEDLRQGGILFTTEGGTFEIEIIQAGQYIKLDQTTGEVGAMGGMIELFYSSSVQTEHRVEYEDSEKEEWIEVNQSSNNMYEIKVAYNPSVNDRNASVVITSSDDNSTDQLIKGVKFAVKQQGRNITTNVSEIITYADEGTSDKYKIEADGMYIIEKGSGDDWYSIKTDKDNNMFEVEFQKNSTGADRSGVIRISLTYTPSGEDTKTVEVSVKQLKSNFLINVEDYGEDIVVD